MREELIRRAFGVLEYAYAPYSKFKVAAALLTKSGKIYTGCNIENAALSPGNCAERTAVFKAVSEGQRRFLAIAVCGGKDGNVTDYCTPCGICRQVMREFADPEHFLVLVAKSADEYREYTLAQLLPESFGPDMLGR